MKENQKKEAEERLAMLGLEESVLRQFKKNGRKFYSERTKLGRLTCGILYWLDNVSSYMEAVKAFEEENDCLVYHVTHEKTTFGDILTCLYVSPYKEEWEHDRADLKSGLKDHKFELCAHCINLTAPEYSEAGYVVVKEAGGGLIRVA